MAQNDSRRFLFRALMFGLFFVLVFYRFWDHSVMYRDSFIFFAPNKFFLVQALKSQGFPFWNPHLFLGMPFAAEIQTGAFYPFNLLFLIFSFGVAHKLFILLHYPLAAINMDLFLRGRGLDRYASILGGLAFALSGYMISQHALVRMLLGAAWAPLAFYFMDRALRGRLIWSAAAAAVMAMQVISSDPLTAGVTAALYSVFVMVRSGLSRDFARGLKILAVSGPLAFAFCAIQIVPTLQMLRLSNRSGGLSLAECTVFSFHPARLVELVWPTPFGLQWPEFFYWAGFGLDAGGLNIPWSMTNYLGLPLVGLAIIGLVFSKRRWKILAAAGAIMFLLLALGRHTPVYGWFHSLVPLFSSFRYPAKYMAWFTGFVVVASALGLETLAEWIEARPKKVLTGAALYTAVVLAIAVVARPAWSWALQEYGSLAAGTTGYASALAHIKSTWVEWTAVNLLCGALLIMAARGILSWKRFAELLIAVAVFDLCLANVLIMPAGPSDIFEFQPLAAEAIHPDGRPPSGEFRIFRAQMEFRDLNPALEDYTRYERQCIWERNTLKRNLDAMQGFEDLISYGSYEFRDGLELFEGGISVDTMALYNVKYVITSHDAKPIQSLPSRTIYKDAKNDFAVHELEGAWPRAYWVPGAFAAADEKEAIRLLKTKDLTRNVILTTSEDIEDPGSSAYSLKPAKILSYQPDEVLIYVNAESPGWLVLSDRYYPGWEAEADGDMVKIYQANVLVRAIRLDAGKYEVIFRYRPPTVLLGAAITLCGIVFIMVWIVRERRKSSDS